MNARIPTTVMVQEKCERCKVDLKNENIIVIGYCYNCCIIIGREAKQKLLEAFKNDFDLISDYVSKETGNIFQDEIELDKYKLNQKLKDNFILLKALNDFLFATSLQDDAITLKIGWKEILCRLLKMQKMHIKKLITLIKKKNNNLFVMNVVKILLLIG